MKQSDTLPNYELEDAILSCLLLKPSLVDEIYINDVVFMNPINRKIFVFFKDFYRKNKSLDLTLMVNNISNQESQKKFVNYIVPLTNSVASTAAFYSYQEQLQEKYKNNQISQVVQKYTVHEIGKDELIDEINDIQSQNLTITDIGKKTPKEILELIRRQNSFLQFDRFSKLTKELNFKTNTVNLIAARPSEGKSALALNLFLDLAKNYKCLYFNLEMTEAEVYERLVGIDSAIPISDIRNSQTQYQESKIIESVNRICSLNYQIINRSQNIKSIKSKIVKEQRDEHLIVFVDYVGYVQNKWGQSDKDRIGEVVREFNNITKDYDCTIFLVAQINRNGVKRVGEDKNPPPPIMEDLKDSGELEQTADTIMMIYDPYSITSKAVEKDIKILIPKARGAKRNVAIDIHYNKLNQRMEIKESWEKQ